MSTNDGEDGAERFLREKREADAKRRNPLIEGQMLRPATAADLLKAAGLGGRDLTGFVNARPKVPDR